MKLLGKHRFTKTKSEEIAYFGAGCFWGVESAFRSFKGVKETRVGYMGGTLENPTYEAVCTGTTGHAEVLEVTFDPDVISFRMLVAQFWRLHDPTTLNRQGPDIGSQYRSAIFTTTPEQLKDAQTAMQLAQRSGRYSQPIVTQVQEAPVFYPAEEYHQQYFERRGINPTCHV